MRGECSGHAGRQREEIGRGSWEAQDHKPLIGHEHMRSRRRLWARRERGKAAAKQRMGGVCDLNLAQVALCEGAWVIERGMNMCARLTV